VDYRRAFDAVFGLQLAIAVGVFVVVTGVLLVAVVANGARRRRKLPFAAAENNALEIGVAVVLGAAAAGLVYLSLSTNDDLAYGDIQPAAARASAQAGQAPVDIDVTAFQWCWQATYPGAPGAPPRRTVTGSCAAPQDRPVIVVPQGRPVQFSISSRDVVHAFWIPELAVKRDANPDHVNTVLMTFDRVGQWLGRCSEYCGLHHMSMDFYVRAVPPDQYDTFLQTGSVPA
jgi:cytochrome c oxidase subunit 2